MNPDTRGYLAHCIKSGGRFTLEDTRGIHRQSADYYAPLSPALHCPCPTPHPCSCGCLRFIAQATCSHTFTALHTCTTLHRPASSPRPQVKLFDFGALVCPTNGCESVLSSPYAQLFGLPLSLYGMLAYGTVGVLAATVARQGSEGAAPEARQATVGALTGGVAALATTSSVLMWVNGGARRREVWVGGVHQNACMRASSRPGGGWGEDALGVAWQWVSRSNLPLSIPMPAASFAI